MFLPYLLSAALLLTLLAWLGREVLGWSRRTVRWATALVWTPFFIEWGRQSFIEGPPIVFLLVVLGVTLGLLAWWGSTYPNRPLVLLLVVPAVLSVSVVFLPGVWVGLAVLNGLIAAAAAVDLFSLARQQSFEAERQVGLTASLAKPHPVSLTISNRAGRGQPVRIRDGVPPELSADPEEFLISLTPASRSTLRYDLRASSRGEFLLKEVHLSVSSRWGLWQRLLRLPCESRLNVYPDMKQLGEYAILARTNRLSLMGLRRTRKIGQDNEFERLRDYTVDDNYKHIEWRSTARRGKLTVKDFQANQSQRVVFMVDCGRMMTGEAAGVSMLDHALNSALLLSFVALRQNDQVGLMCFSDEVHSLLPPKGGREQMNRILHASYNQFPRMVESRYDEAFHRLTETVRKRALVILITNVIDEVNAHQISRHLTTLSGKHLPMGVMLRDHALFDPINAVEDDYEAHAAAGDNTPGGVLSIPEHRLYPAAAAADILLWRRRVLANLETRGVLLVDTFPENLTAPLVNQYMEIKARHLL
ncbi:hypothetical protein Pla123a_09270 [Posidoniimonas polymericola]|uniref:DUF58 domain-containing protein n=1 Tax=Posidoniimonas polymericola TaxID=2528002 RepID=A0A5C5YU48_9BACT|nr:DUF58 domain-containing protein [Posidoniimonas polymericola]TWT78137.1 hypothetical protein Pla123a_09270 [Posidoniimonas polymericola]